MPEPLGPIPSPHHWYSHCLLRSFPQGWFRRHTDSTGLRSTLLWHSSDWGLEFRFGISSPSHKTANSQDYQENRYLASSTAQTWIPMAVLYTCCPACMHKKRSLYRTAKVGILYQLPSFLALINVIILVSAGVQTHFTWPTIWERWSIPTPSLFCFAFLTHFP